ncbi:MFS transporter [Gordonia sp. SL306]|uniref:MFS transporter n=1 Tax=Gordonia sp. SL306 TaxID=2995145 RepID=UPI0022703954|nr:MFS transporter [Gordonia sp. SL306]WAC56796.1 MFS transporter [Gordonia sp. SL306]
MTTTHDTSPARTGPSNLLMWAILGLVLLADALDMIDSTVTNIAAPTIADELGAGEGLIKWLGASYALAMGVLLVVGGRLGDKFGQRRVFLVGMAGFTIASAVCGLSPDAGLLVVARIAQGAFGALMLPQGMAIMTKTFSREMLAKAFGLFGPLLGIASVGGPVLAGFVIDWDIAGLSWRPIFLVNVVLGVIGLALAVRLLPRDDGNGDTVIDGWGSGILAVAMFGLMFGLIEGSTAGWGPIPIASLIVGTCAAALFAYRQAHTADPLLRPSLFRNRGFTSGLVMGLLVFAATSGLVYVLSLFMQLGIGASARETSLGLLPLTLGIIVAAGATMGGLMTRLGRTLVAIGLVGIVVGVGWLLALVAASGTDLGLWMMALPIFVIGLGMGACYGTIFDIALGDIDADEAGSASGSMSAIQQLATGIGSATVTTVFFQLATGSEVHAMEISLVMVLGAAAICLPVVRLLPRRAPAELAH